MISDPEAGARSHGAASPASSGSASGGELAKQRRARRNKERGGSKASKYDGNGNGNGKGKGNGNGNGKAGATGGNGGSVIWTVLVIGLLFCLFDVGYMMGSIDRSVGRQQGAAQSAVSASVQSLANKMQIPSIVTNQVAKAKAKVGLDPTQAASASAPAPAGKKAENLDSVGQMANINININTNGAEVEAEVVDPIYEANEPPPFRNEEQHPDDAIKKLIVDKEPIVRLLQEAGIRIDDPNFSKNEDNLKMLSDLPTWSQVVDLYGENPVVHGLETCEPFRKHSDLADHFVSVAGTFNTGTNLMSELLIHNCHMQDRMNKYGPQNRGIRWQVPWGKHTPPGDEKFRQTHKTTKDITDVQVHNIFPAVTIRDPVVWLSSMCRHAYTAKWPHTLDDCPNFSPVRPDGTRRVLATDVKYADGQILKHHDSILHLWNDYYNDYWNATFPRLVVRYEDLLFHPKEVTTAVCECAGGRMQRGGGFTYIVDSAKKGLGGHGAFSKRTGYVDAMIRYGSAEKRYAPYQRSSDLGFIRDHVDKAIMNAMGYPMPDLSRAKN